MTATGLVAMIGIKIGQHDDRDKPRYRTKFTIAKADDAVQTDLGP
jgi:hypothetical protein